MSGTSVITLPRGLFDRDGARHAVAELSPVTGYFEAQVGEASSDADHRLGPASVSQLLARALTKIGAFEHVDVEHTAALSRGDRAHALLQLQRTLFGDRLALIVRCENPDCQQEADLSLTIGELLSKRTELAETYFIDTDAGRVSVREPTGADDEAVSGLTKEQASAELWSRLISDFAGQGRLSRDEWTALPAALKESIAVGFAELTCSPTLAFMVPCPSCRAWIELELDPAQLLARQLGISAERLYSEVHTLAFAYHWSEHEILSLPRERRWRYLELIGRQFSGRTR